MEITYGTPVEVAKGVRRITCNNPSPLTGAGTNTYLIGADPAVVIDPGPPNEAHLRNILRAATKISHICVTHSHLDHSPLAAELSDATGAPVCGFGPSGAGTSAVMSALPDLGGGEGVDLHFAPDVLLEDGAQIRTSLGPLTAHHSPGHFGNHMTFEQDGVVFSGDLVMGWATTLISPPHGDLTDFMASCAALRERKPTLLLPGHGEAVLTPKARIDWLLAHRTERSAQIKSALAKKPASISDITALVYFDVPETLWPAAERNVLAHLIDLIGKNKASCIGPVGPHALFRCV